MDWKLKSNASFAGVPGPVMVCILDGVGIGRHDECDAVRLARTPHLDWLADRIKREVHAFCEKVCIAFRQIGIGSWFLSHFVQREPTNARDLRELDNLMRGEILGNYIRYHGVYMPDLHTVFMSAVHTDGMAGEVPGAIDPLHLREFAAPDTIDGTRAAPLPQLQPREHKHVSQGDAERTVNNIVRSHT